MKDGAAPDRAWQTLKRVNQADLKPGDSVLFKRGQMWRGQLVPQSGKEGQPITYGAYGDGPKPLFLGSADRSAPGDWHCEGRDIWATTKMAFVDLPPLSKLEATPWSIHSEGGAQVKSSVSSGSDSPALARIECLASGSASNHIQLFNHGLKLREGEYGLFTFRAKSSKGFVLPGARLSKAGPPYTSYATAARLDATVAEEWTEFAVRFHCVATADDGRITLALGGSLPAGAVFEFQPLTWKRLQGNDQDVLSLDVGNIIFDQAKSVGIKKWKLDDLKQPGDYWYSAATGQVMLYAEKNPAETFKSIELALTRHIIDEGKKSFVTYENLALKYGAAHGIGGASTHHIVVRQCDISWIGGGHQLTMPDGRPVRYGNGIEFWSSAHDNLVEGCRVWEIYDAALTNQGDNKNTQENIAYRDNVIWNSEYSFEFWNGKKSHRDEEQHSQSHNIRFEHNTCVNAGYGWGHAQRPDPNGRHLMFYDNPVPTTDVLICENIFSGATESDVRFCNDWTSGLTMDRNCWFAPGRPVVLFMKAPFTAAQFADYQRQTNLDMHSIVADPRFVNVARQDFRLAPDSPALKLSERGGPVGARQRMTE